MKIAEPVRVIGIALQLGGPKFPVEEVRVAHPRFDRAEGCAPANGHSDERPGGRESRDEPLRGNGRRNLLF